MLIGKKNTTTKIEKAFQQGYTNAVSALSQLIHEKIYYENCLNKFTQAKYLHTCLKQFTTEGCHVLTTELFGDMAGKSYWVLDNEAYERITQRIQAGHMPPHLEKEFVKELDNILSAAVISQLADKLNLNMYGDIPHLLERPLPDLHEIIIADFRNWGTREFYVNAATLSFDQVPGLRSLFLWVLDGHRLKSQNP